MNSFCTFTFLFHFGFSCTVTQHQTLHVKFLILSHFQHYWMVNCLVGIINLTAQWTGLSVELMISCWVGETSLLTGVTLPFMVRPSPPPTSPVQPDWLGMAQYCILLSPLCRSAHSSLSVQFCNSSIIASSLSQLCAPPDSSQLHCQESIDLYCLSTLEMKVCQHITGMTQQWINCLFESDQSFLLESWSFTNSSGSAVTVYTSSSHLTWSSEVLKLLYLLWLAVMSVGREGITCTCLKALSRQNKEQKVNA